MASDVRTWTRTSSETDSCIAEETPFQLIVWNDDVNTFDWVIESLIQICGHQQEQAEQCALLVHFKGKCTVKEGFLEDLKPMCTGLLDRGISATLEEIVPS